MDVISLQSGSSGNCVFVCNGDTRLLFDAGISASKAESRLSECGYDIRSCHALILSHEHYDHISGLGPFHRRFGLPVHANLRTWNAARAKPSTGSIGSPNFFVSESPFRLDRSRLSRFERPTMRSKEFASSSRIATQGSVLGSSPIWDMCFKASKMSWTRSMRYCSKATTMSKCCAVDRIPVPERPNLRKRGHLSNLDAASLIERCDASQLQWVCLGHLSAHNNSPEVAMATHRARHGDRFSLYCADRDGITQLPAIKPTTFTLRSA